MQWLPPTLGAGGGAGGDTDRGQENVCRCSRGEARQAAAADLRAALAPLLSPSSTCRTSRQNESPGFNRGFQGRPMRLDLGVDGPRRSQASLIRPSREAAQAALHRNSNRWAVQWRRITSSSNAPRPLAPPANGTTTISTCSKMAKLSGASSRPMPCRSALLGCGRDANPRLCRNARGGNGGIR